MPLYHIREDTFHKAFVMGSLVSALVAVTTIFLKDEFQRLHDPDSANARLPAWLVLATIGAAGLGSLIIYYVFHWLFGFGGGMLASSTEEELNHQFVATLRRQTLTTPAKTGPQA